MKKGYIPPLIEDQLIALFAKANKRGAARLTCEASRAAYLARWGGWLKTRAALESTVMYDSDHPIYGKGIYWNIKLTPGEEGLEVSLSDEISTSYRSLIMEAAFRSSNLTIKMDSEKAARTVVSRLRAEQGRLLQKQNVYEARWTEIIVLSFQLAPDDPTRVVFKKDNIEEVEKGMEEEEEENGAEAS
jgi:hypothetical protein